MLKKYFDTLLRGYFAQPQSGIKGLDHLERDVMAKINMMNLNKESALWIGFQYQAASVVIALVIGVGSSVMNINNDAITMEEFSPNSTHLSLNLDRYL